MSAQPGGEAWMPNGFPPPSFVVETERVTTFAGGRGRWIVAGGILGAVLLLAGILLIAQAKDDGTALRTGSSSTTVTTTASPITQVPTPGVDPTAEDPEATLPPTGGGDAPPGGGGGTPTPGGAATPGTTASPTAPPTPGPPPPPGILSASAPANLTTTYPGKPGTTTVKLTNTGKGALTYTSKPSTGLSVEPSSGAIDPGGSANVTVSLNGDTFGEGPYPGSVLFQGGGNQTVQIRGTVAKPPTINGPNAGKFTVPTPPTNPCTGKWSIRANVTDVSRIDSVKVRFTSSTPTVDTDMVRPADPDGEGTWILDRPEKMPAGSLKFVIVARDSLGAEAVSPEETVTC